MSDTTYYSSFNSVLILSETNQPIHLVVKILIIIIRNSERSYLLLLSYASSRGALGQMFLPFLGHLDSIFPSVLAC